MGDFFNILSWITGVSAYIAFFTLIGFLCRSIDPPAPPKILSSLVPEAPKLTEKEKNDYKKRAKIAGIVLCSLVLITLFSHTISDAIVESNRREKEEMFKKNEEIFAKDAFLLKKKYDHTIQFDKNKSGLNVDAKSRLDSMIIDLMELKNKYNYDIYITVVGHTSSEGDVKLNQKLSEERAESCKEYLMKCGYWVCFSEGKGSSEPLDEGKPELNRRIEFFFRLVDNK